MAPATGKILADLALDQDTGHDISGFRLTRFPDVLKVKAALWLVEWSASAKTQQGETSVNVRRVLSVSARFSKWLELYYHRNVSNIYIHVNIYIYIYTCKYIYNIYIYRIYI